MLEGEVLLDVLLAGLLDGAVVGSSRTVGPALVVDVERLIASCTQRFRQVWRVSGPDSHLRPALVKRRGGVGPQAPLRRQLRRRRLELHLRCLPLQVLVPLQRAHPLERGVALHRRLFVHGRRSSAGPLVLRILLESKVSGSIRALVQRGIVRSLQLGLCIPLGELVVLIGVLYMGLGASEVEELPAAVLNVDIGRLVHLGYRLLGHPCLLVL